ncbi:hypothetical protein J2Y45_002821 [Dyadobacter sp. BE34]|uniref:Capsule assembly Wzi family protein n=1 Tax=Dyadobacter fermentans TaxID=94254 RepID=A0ABU1QUQ7_9BACT|nr:MULTISPECIES: hypothetical protein [Dyadobacter]MDR6804871.1 hypothetical protein [Dyadobacter fermentans]MDR7043370.1 hypothetical protein [Dyadobacter sp. BE242]MDR7197682.1 hypothetical protein [Dyadobacter sp. BE34]MDR7214885.1 hypothetical protein [Dyadobacter sp. BE31]MDR7262420.1 hypothetical protein [Dyadobacter sp. BE32]
MKIKVLIAASLTLLAAHLPAQAQDTLQYKLRLTVPLVDYPQLANLPQRYVSMDQSLEYARGMYELSFWGIDALGNVIVRPKSPGKKIWNGILKYGMTLGFSRFASELPIPLGEWAHEEFHRTVLGVNGIASKNGNWFPNRWDGTVYGITDAALSALKQTNPNALLYAYTAGVQSEVLLNKRIVVEDFYKKRTLPKGALVLYNAWYVHNYFRFSTSPGSDSAKVWSPAFESPLETERDFAGADLTAWAYDMFSPETAFTERTRFKGGEGVNRRVGFSELSKEAQTFLLRQKKLSLLNYLNPAILMINRIRLGRGVAFSFFTQYAPTHFGNSISLIVPVQAGSRDLLFGAHRYNNRDHGYYGIELGVANHRLADKWYADLTLQGWQQPESFLKQEHLTGGAAHARLFHAIGKGLSAYVAFNGKTRGWEMGSPYLAANLSAQFGMRVEAH